MKKVGFILNKVMMKLGLSERYNEQKSVLFWEGVVGEKISKRTKALYAKNGKLVVEVENTTWMNELSFLKVGIIERINKELGRWIIKDIVFLIKRCGDGDEDIGENRTNRV